MRCIQLTIIIVVCWSSTTQFVLIARVDPKHPTLIQSWFASARYTSHYYARRLHIYTQPSSSLPTQSSTVVETEYVIKAVAKKRLSSSVEHCSDEARMYIHVVAPAIWDKMEHLRELQWVRAVVNLDKRRVMSGNQKQKPMPEGTCARARYLPRAGQSRSQ